MAKLTNKDIFVPSETYKTSDSELKSALQEYVGNKGSLDKNDKVFIEKQKETPETANTVAREKVRAVLDETVLTKVGSTSGTSPKTVKIQLQK